MSEPNPTPRVGLSRELTLRTLVLALLLLWPLILFGRPGYIGDSAAYEKGGKVAVEFVAEKLGAARVAVPVNGASGPVRPQAQAAGVKDARSIPYSVAAYLLRWPGYTMIALALAQSLIAAFVCAVAAACVGVWSQRDFAAIAIVMAAASPLATFTDFALPDVFAGVLVVSELMLFCFYERLSTALRLALAAIAAFAVAAHASILPLAAWLAILGTALLLWRWRREEHPAPRAAWLWAPLVIGTGVTMAAGFVAFHETSVVAKRYPHALARSVADGPARWYLEKECTQPRYAVCEVFGTHIPGSVVGFLFAPTGLDAHATPAQMDRIRAEEREIVVRAAMAYPATELGNFADHFTRQFFEVDARTNRFGDVIITDPSGEPFYIDTPDQSSTAIWILDVLGDILLFLCVVWMALRFRTLTQREKLAFGMLVSVLVVNAAFCVLASGITDRYQARISWAIPLLVLSFALARRRRTAFLRPSAAATD